MTTRAQTLYLKGNLDKATCEDFYKEFKDMTPPEEKLLIAVNLHDVTGIKSEGMIFLRSIFSKVKKSGGKMCFIESNPLVHDKILISGLLYLVPFFSSPAFGQRYFTGK